MLEGFVSPGASRLVADALPLSQGQDKGPACGSVCCLHDGTVGQVTEGGELPPLLQATQEVCLPWVPMPRSSCRRRPDRSQCRYRLRAAGLPRSPPGSPVECASLDDPIAIEHRSKRQSSNGKYRHRLRIGRPTSLPGTTGRHGMGRARGARARCARTNARAADLSSGVCLGGVLRCACRQVNRVGRTRRNPAPPAGRAGVHGLRFFMPPALT